MPSGLPDFTKKTVAPETDKKLDEIIKRQDHLDKKFWISTVIAIIGIIIAILAVLR